MQGREKRRRGLQFPREEERREEREKDKGQYIERVGNEAIYWVEIVSSQNFPKYIGGRTNFKNTVDKEVNGPSET